MPGACVRPPLNLRIVALKAAFFHLTADVLKGLRDSHSCRTEKWLSADERDVSWQSGLSVGLERQMPSMRAIAAALSSDRE